MNTLRTVKHYLAHQLHRSKPVNPQAAYDLWAGSYDSQPDNLMLAWDQEIFSGIMKEVDVKNKIIADIGCGTGRHWKEISDREPQKLIGFDVSEGMLKKLKQKFPQSETHHLINDKLQDLKNESCNIIVSTLAIAHIEHSENALKEWNRVLKAGGDMIITDYHPTALGRGARRTFSYHDKTITVKNYVHPIIKLKEIARQLHLEVFRFVEKSIDESAKPYYEKQNALPVYEAWKGTPIIYGIHLKKANAAM